MNKETKETVEILCEYLNINVADLKNIYKLIYKLFVKLNNAVDIGIYLYNSDLELLYTNEKNIKILAKNGKVLKEKGYESFISNYHPDDKGIIKKREKLIEDGKTFNTIVRYKNKADDYQMFHVINCLVNPEAEREKRVYAGFAIPLNDMVVLSKEHEALMNENAYLRQALYLNEKFTDRQRAVINCFFYKSIEEEEIGKILSISTYTVHSHLINIFLRAGVHSKIELLVMLKKYMVVAKEPKVE